MGAEPKEFFLFFIGEGQKRGEVSQTLTKKKKVKEKGGEKHHTHKSVFDVF